MNTYSLTNSILLTRAGSFYYYNVYLPEDWSNWPDQKTDQNFPQLSIKLDNKSG